MATENVEETIAEAVHPKPPRRWWPQKANGDKPDPPHALTVLVQAVSAVITLSALGFTVYFANRQFSNAEKAIAISEQGLRIGQRAYLTVRQGRLTVGPQVSYWGPDPREPTEVIVKLPNQRYADWRHTRIQYGFELQNPGNSPAVIKEMTFALQTPRGWTVSTAPPNTIVGNLRTVKVTGKETFMAAPEGEEIGPRTTSIQQFAPVFNLTESAAKTIQDGASVVAMMMKGGEAITLNRDETRVTGNIIYSDVFGGQYSLHWCWTYNEDYLHKSEVPLPCVEQTGIKVTLGKEETPSTPKK